MINLKTIAFSTTKGALMGAAYGSSIGSVQGFFVCGIVGGIGEIGKMINNGPSFGLNLFKGEISMQYKTNVFDMLFQPNCIAIIAGVTGVIGAGIGAAAGLVYGVAKSFF